MAQHYDDNRKAQVLAALLTGQSISQVAREYNIPVGTVKYWSANREKVIDENPTTKAAIGDLLLEYLKETLITVTAQQRHFRNEEWLNKQDASELAVLHGVSVDKSIRLLEALADTQE